MYEISYLKKILGGGEKKKKKNTWDYSVAWAVLPSAAANTMQQMKA